MKKVLIIINVILLLSIIAVSSLLIFYSGNNKENSSEIYRVTFMVDSNEYKVVEVNSNIGRIDTIPENPYKEGYNFLYWELNGVEYNFNNKIDKSIILNAKFEEYKESKVYASNFTETIKVGNSTQIKVNEKVKTYTSSNSKVVTVSKDGKIKAVGTGKATITAKTESGETATVEVVSVSKNETIVDVSGINLNKTSATVKVGETVILSETITPSNATNKNVLWSSSNTRVATVTKGVVKASREGTAVITVESSNGIKAKCTITVEKNDTAPSQTTVNVSSISLNKEKANMIVGKTYDLIATVKPDNATNKNVIWSSSDTSVAKVDSTGKITALKVGKTVITAKTVDGNKIANCTVTVYSDNEDRVQVYFLNTQDSPNMISSGTTYSSNESIIVKTKDNKYVLFDTGNDDKEVFRVIYNKLKALQGKSKVVIDYMIISHLDADHIGNAKRIMNSSYITVKNLIIKNEKTLMSSNLSVASTVKSRYNAVINAAKSNNVNIISNLSEGETIKLGKYVEMTFFNTKDVYSGMTCGRGTNIRFTSNTKSTSLEYYKTSDGKYVYYDNTDGKYPKKELKTTTKILENTNSNRFKRYFYAYIFKGDRGGCSSNGNSYAIMLSVKLENNETKYIYMPGDLENVGIDIFPETLSGFNNKVYGNGGSVFYDNLSFDTKNKKFTNDKNNIKMPSETKIAKAIANNSKFKGKLKNIVIYQESHHGFNNAKDAIDILGLNRKDIYAVATASGTFKKSSSLIRVVSYYYSLSNVPESHKLITGKETSSETKNGVYCYIRYNSTVKCENY